LQLHPLDCDRLGVSAGTPVKVISTRTSVALDVQPDGSVPRGVARVAFNQADVAVAELIDLDATVTDVRVETL
jgi:anaerobic selenocysteine-containing dehydrogenase